MKIGSGLAGVALLLALAACGKGGFGGGSTISAQDVGASWPFTVSEVKVVCAPTLALFITADDKAYPLNGQAERHPELYAKGPLSKLNDIQKVDPVTSKLSPDTRMPLNDVMQKAIAACTAAGKWDMAKG
jgi:hypothetical protein